MKNLTLVIAMILFSSCVTSQFHELIDFAPGPPWWSIPFPPHLTADDHLHFRPSPELAKCFSDHKMVTKCLNEIFKKIPIGSDSSECCAPVKTLYEDCEKTDFGSFRNPFFNYYVKKYCSPQTAPTPEAPSPA